MVITLPTSRIATLGVGSFVTIRVSQIVKQQMSIMSLPTFYSSFVHSLVGRHVYSLLIFFFQPVEWNANRVQNFGGARSKDFEWIIEFAGTRSL